MLPRQGASTALDSARKATCGSAGSSMAKSRTRGTMDFCAAIGAGPAERSGSRNPTDLPDCQSSIHGESSMHFLLMYDFGPDYLERRPAFRPAHLLRSWT